MRRWRSCCSVEGAVWLTLLLVVGGAVSCVIATLWPHHWPWEAKAARERIRAELPLAEERWARNGVLDYDVDVKAVTHNSICVSLSSGITATLQVRGGQLVPTEVGQEFEERCSITSFLPPQVFETVRHSLEMRYPLDQDLLIVEFDPHYGFVSRYARVDSSRMPQVQRYLTNFRPVPPATPPPP